jgi:hypothetical protein
MAYQGKPLARRASKYNIDSPTANARTLSDLIAGQPNDRSGQNCTLRKIECVDSAMNRIDFNRRD